MTEAPPRRAEIDPLGPPAYDRYVRPHLRPEDDGKFVAVDVDSGDYEIDETDAGAVLRLSARRPFAHQWLTYAGYERTGRLPTRTASFVYRSHTPPPDTSDVIRLGQQIFESRIESTLRPEDHGKFIAIDVDTGHYEMDRDQLAAGDRIHTLRTGARVFMMRVGHKGLEKFGFLRTVRRLDLSTTHTRRSSIYGWPAPRVCKMSRP
jgi:hypothetical protein